MTNEELKKKIVDVLRGNIEYELHYFPDDNYTEVEFDYGKLADALIAAGIGDVKSWKISDADKEQSSINYYCEMREWKDKCKEAEHRAEAAERALFTACINLIKDEEDNVNMELLAHVVYTKYLRRAEKELAEEKNEKTGIVQTKACAGAM